MPRINIRETENEVMKLLNPTENVVLVPLLCKSDLEDKSVREYKPRNKSVFIADFKQAVVPQYQYNKYGEGEYPETSFTYINMLLDYGLNVVVKPIVSTEDTVRDEQAITEEINTAISAGAFEEFKDKNLYNIKFITTGAHANYLTEESSENNIGCYQTLATIAMNRGDSVALLELEQDVVCEPSIHTVVENHRDIKYILSREAGAESGEEYKYAAFMFPWGSYKVADGIGNQYADLKLPGSFGYLSAFANSTQTNADWYAAAGVTRGAIPNLNRLLCDIGESQMHILLSDSETGDKGLKFIVNPIMKVSEYGVKIWGNKVAAVLDDKAESYQSYLNIRVLLCDIKKQIYYAATRVTFEPNDMITWLNFIQLVNKLLDSMKGNRGLEYYSWRRRETEKKATIEAVLTIKPIEAVEYFDITVNLTSQSAEVAEEI